MWDLQTASPFGRLSKRYILTFVATLLMTCLASIFALAPSAAAADADWDGAAILYNGSVHVKSADGKVNDPRGVPVDSLVYSYVSPKSDPGNTSAGPQKASFIYFPGSTDITQATSAQYIMYDYIPPSSYVNPTATKVIGLNPQSSSSSTGTTCSSEATGGLGWIICYATKFLAGAMDSLYGILSGFLSVRPAQTGQTDALYRAWSLMRNFANIAFVIGFLFVIYSQLTNVGLSSYGVKKILPRIIIAAILVNISYWICAIAIDVSNILGYAIQDVFVGLRKTVAGSAISDNWELFSWKGVSSFILSGGTAVGVASIGAYMFFSTTTVAASLYLLLPILLGVLIAVLVALLVMAARQAIITILVIVAPLAFVAYLLPNTEKYFEKWRSLFMTMLLVFPLFSIIFGGSQLAGIAIIQNAENINTVLLGMAVQVAPIVITPLLVKFSGSLIARVAGMVNNPNKGIMDRTRKWSQDKSEKHRDKTIANPNARGLNRFTRNKTIKRRHGDALQKAHQAGFDNAVHRDPGYQAIDAYNRENEREKKIIENHHDIVWNARVRFDQKSLQQELELNVTTDEASLGKAKVDAMYQEFKAGVPPVYGPMTSSMTSLMNTAQDTTRDIALTALRKQMAERKQNIDRSKEIDDNLLTIDGLLLQTYAGGIMGESGRKSALANAKSIVDRAFEEDVKNIQATISYDIQTDNTALQNKFLTSTTLTERIAYAKSLSINGEPGIATLKDSIQLYESSTPGAQDISDLKKFLSTDSGIRSAGKDLDDWISNSKAGNTLLDFNTISNDPGTWAKMAADKFAAMNPNSQLKALTVLRASDRPAFDALKARITADEANNSKLKSHVIAELNRP